MFTNSWILRFSRSMSAPAPWYAAVCFMVSMSTTLTITLIACLSSTLLPVMSSIFLARSSSSIMRLRVSAKFFALLFTIVVNLDIAHASLITFPGSQLSCSFLHASHPLSILTLCTIVFNSPPVYLFRNLQSCSPLSHQLCSAVVNHSSPTSMFAFRVFSSISFIPSNISSQ